MTPLFREPVAATSPGRIVALGAVGLAVLAMLGLVWWTFSPIIPGSGGVVLVEMPLVDSGSHQRVALQVD